MTHRAKHLVLPALVVLLTTQALPAHGQITETSVTLAWTAPGDDSLTGTATRYDVRWSLTPITTIAQFNAATAVAGVAAPHPAGTSESALVSGLTPSTTYYFAVRTYDEAGNVSGLSNPLSATTLVSTDLIRPAPMALTLGATTSTSVTVSWTDVGDDSLTGVATAVDLRWATVAITDANWATANVVSGLPAPAAPGTAHSKTVNGLDRTRDLWFAIRARDDVNQVSALSPTFMVPHLLDTAPPASPSGVTGSPDANGVRVTWAANTEPDLAGYNVYRALAAAGTYSRLNGSLLVTNDYQDNSPPDTVAIWYEVSAVDATGNESARSAPFRVLLQGAGIPAWSVSTPYPNPSHIGNGVTLPLEVPGAGPYDAVVEIQDAAGEHVRTLHVSNAAPGPYSLVWDGRNDAGRGTAPGVYRAWLRAGDQRELVRFVRLPLSPGRE